LAVTVAKLGNISEQNLVLRDKQNLKRQNESQGTVVRDNFYPPSAYARFDIVYYMLRCTDFTKFSRLNTVSRHIHKSNFIHAHRKSLAFPELIFMKLINGQLHYTHLSYTKFIKNQSTNRKVAYIKKYYYAQKCASY
jgi:hypothetical protein